MLTLDQLNLLISGVKSAYYHQPKQGSLIADIIEEDLYKLYEIARRYEQH